MDNDEVLGHLLKIESEAAALVNDAQEEADKRTAEAEQQGRVLYEERYHQESERLENELQQSKERIRQHYQKELEACNEKIAAIPVDANSFSALLNRFVTEDS